MDFFFFNQSPEKIKSFFVVTWLLTVNLFFLLATCAYVYYLADLGGCNTKNHPIDLKKWWGSLMD